MPNASTLDELADETFNLDDLDLGGLTVTSMHDSVAMPETGASSGSSSCSSCSSCGSSSCIAIDV